MAGLIGLGGEKDSKVSGKDLLKLMIDNEIPDILNGDLAELYKISCENVRQKDFEKTIKKEKAKK